MEWKQYFWLSVCQFFGHSRHSSFRCDLDEESEFYWCPRCNDYFTKPMPKHKFPENIDNWPGFKEYWDYKNAGIEPDYALISKLKDEKQTYSQKLWQAKRNTPNPADQLTREM